jgi:hypothetical protein
MEWFLLRQNNITYSICINIDTKNTIDVFVRDRGLLYHGRSVHADYNNSHTAVLLDVFKQRYKKRNKKRYKKRNKKQKMIVADLVLSFRHDVGFLAVGDLKKPDSCCSIGISLVRNKVIEMLYVANEDLNAVTTLIDLKNKK